MLLLFIMLSTKINVVWKWSCFFLCPRRLFQCPFEGCARCRDSLSLTMCHLIKFLKIYLVKWLVKNLWKKSIFIWMWDKWPGAIIEWSKFLTQIFRRHVRANWWKSTLILTTKNVCNTRKRVSNLFLRRHSPLSVFTVGLYVSVNIIRHAVNAKSGDIFSTKTSPPAKHFMTNCLRKTPVTFLCKVSKLSSCVRWSYLVPHNLNYLTIRFFITTHHGQGRPLIPTYIHHHVRNR